MTALAVIEPIVEERLFFLDTGHSPNATSKLATVTSDVKAGDNAPLVTMPDFQGYELFPPHALELLLPCGLKRLIEDPSFTSFKGAFHHDITGLFSPQKIDLTLPKQTKRRMPGRLSPVNRGVTQKEQKRAQASAGRAYNSFVAMLADPESRSALTEIDGAQIERDRKTHYIEFTRDPHRPFKFTGKDALGYEIAIYMRGNVLHVRGYTGEQLLVDKVDPKPRGKSYARKPGVPGMWMSSEFDCEPVYRIARGKTAPEVVDEGDFFLADAAGNVFHRQTDMAGQGIELQGDAAAGFANDGRRVIDVPDTVGRLDGERDVKDLAHGETARVGIDLDAAERPVAHRKGLVAQSRHAKIAVAALIAASAWLLVGVRIGRSARSSQECVPHVRRFPSP